MYKFVKSEAVTIIELIVANKTVLNVLKLMILLLLLIKSIIIVFISSCIRKLQQWLSEAKEKKNMSLPMI